MANIIRKIGRAVSIGIDNICESKRSYLIARKFDREAKIRLKLIKGGYRGSKREFEDYVIKPWAKYGVKPKKFWYDLFCGSKGKYDYRFIPDPLWYLKILSYFNNFPIFNAYADKGILSRILPDVKKPETVVKNIAGYYYNGDKEQLITQREAERLCEQEYHLIIKPYRGSEGKGIIFYDKDNPDRPTVRDIFNSLKFGFVVQKIVRQHKDFARLNKDSVNTLRVLSFHFKGNVHILSAQLRIGGKGVRVDNVSSGGSACPVHTDGRLYEKAVNRQSKWSEISPSGVKYKDFVIPNYIGIIETIKRLHCQLPYFNIVGWDFTVDELGDPVLIEFNLKPAQNQIGCGLPTFGELTDEVLEDVFIKKTLEGAFSLGD